MFYAGNNFEFQPFVRFQIFGLGGYGKAFDSPCPSRDRFVDGLCGGDVIKDPHQFGILDLEVDFNCVHVRRVLFAKYRCFFDAVEVHAEVVFQVLVDNSIQSADLDFVRLARNGIYFCI